MGDSVEIKKKIPKLPMGIKIIGIMVILLSIRGMIRTIISMHTVTTERFKFALSTVTSIMVVLPESLSSSSFTNFIFSTYYIFIILYSLLLGISIIMLSGSKTGLAIFSSYMVIVGAMNIIYIIYPFTYAMYSNRVAFGGGIIMLFMGIHPLFYWETFSRINEYNRIV